MARFWYFGLYRGASRGRVQAVRTPSPRPEMTSGFLIHLVFCQKKTMWFIGVEVEQETSAPPSKKNPGSAPGIGGRLREIVAHRGSTVLDYEEYPQG